MGIINTLVVIFYLYETSCMNLLAMSNEKFGTNIVP